MIFYWCTKGRRRWQSSFLFKQDDESASIIPSPRIFHTLTMLLGLLKEYSKQRLVKLFFYWSSMQIQLICIVTLAFHHVPSCGISRRNMAYGSASVWTNSTQDKSQIPKTQNSAIPGIGKIFLNGVMFNKVFSGSIPGAYVLVVGTVICAKFMHWHTCTLTDSMPNTSSRSCTIIAIKTQIPLKSFKVHCNTVGVRLCRCAGCVAYTFGFSPCDVLCSV